MRLNKAVRLLFAAAFLLCFSSISNAISLEFTDIQMDDQQFKWNGPDNYRVEFTGTTNTAAGSIIWSFKLKDNNWSWSYILGDYKDNYKLDSFKLAKSRSGLYSFSGMFGEVDEHLISALGGTPGSIEGSFTRNSPLFPKGIFVEVNSISLPESATMFLLGFGLIGVASFGRNKIIKKK
jgi:hypothetical protein